MRASSAGTHTAATRMAAADMHATAAARMTTTARMAAADMHATAAARMTTTARMAAATPTGSMSTATPAATTAFRRGRVGRSRQRSRKNNNGNSKFESQHDFPQSI